MTGPCVNVFGNGHSMGAAENPSGSFQVKRVGRPESPGFFQYVCHSGSMRRWRPTWKGWPGRMDSTSETS